MRPTSLDSGSVKSMVSDPMADLGISFPSDGKAMHRLISMTGGLPHLVQFYCEQIVEHCVVTGRSVVDGDVFKAIESKFEVAMYFLSPILELSDPVLQQLCQLLLQVNRAEFSLADVSSFLQSLGRPVDKTKAARICNELVIQNILVWQNGKFEVANGALRHFARHGGYLS